VFARQSGPGSALRTVRESHRDAAFAPSSQFHSPTVIAGGQRRDAEASERDQSVAPEDQAVARYKSYSWYARNAELIKRHAEPLGLRPERVETILSILDKLF
jgi:hypothetical protein